MCYKVVFGTDQVTRRPTTGYLLMLSSVRPAIVCVVRDEACDETQDGRGIGGGGGGVYNVLIQI